MWYQQLKILYFDAGGSRWGLLEWGVEFLLKTTTWRGRRVLHFTITWILQVVRLNFTTQVYGQVQVGGFTRQIQPLISCMLHIKCTKDVNLIQGLVSTERYGHYSSRCSHFSPHQSNQDLDQTDCTWKPLHNCLRFDVIFFSFHSLKSSFLIFPTLVRKTSQTWKQDFDGKILLF